MKSTLAMCGCLAVAACTTTPSPAPPVAAGPSPYLLLFAGDRDGKDEDFFAVVDLRDGSPDLGKVIATTPIGLRGAMPHHTEYALPPPGQPLFANAHHPEATLLVDVSRAPALAIGRTLALPAPLRFPHDFARLPNGNVIAGFLRSEGASPRADDPSPGGHGGIAEYTADGALLRSASAAAPGIADPIRTYAIVPMPDLDRIVTTSARMMEKHSANVVQIWRYSDFRLLHTLSMPDGRRPDGTPLDWAGEMPFGPRRMRDGSVLMNAYMCGFYRLTGIDTDAPVLSHVYDIHGRDPARPMTRVGCSVPVVTGDYWIMPVAESQMLFVLDVSDPAAPREVSRFALADGFNAHWAAKDPGSDRIVVGAEVEKEKGVYVLRFDAATGTLSVDPAIGKDTATPGYLPLDGPAWPHGATGEAWAHAALFLPGPRPGR